jgi:hypothetical protein
VIWLWASAAVMIVTALIHSFLGEKDLVRPLLSIDEGILKVELERQTVRLAWHLTTALILLSAALVAWPGTPGSLIILAGAIWILLGLVIAIYTRGKHLGWPIFVVAGALAWAGVAA